MTAHQLPRPARLRELEAEATIIAAARAAGWYVHGSRTTVLPSGRHATPLKGNRGFPDLFLAHHRHPIALAVELKRKPNQVEPDQQAWHDALRHAGITVHVWWVPEQLTEILAYLANPRHAEAVITGADGRWTATIFTPDGAVTKTCPQLAPLVAWCERWATGRNRPIPIRILTPIGTTA